MSYHLVRLHLAAAVMLSTAGVAHALPAPFLGNPAGRLPDSFSASETDTMLQQLETVEIFNVSLVNWASTTGSNARRVKLYNAQCKSDIGSVHVNREFDANS